MSNLVSKNPVLRFKEGRKIMKYLNTPGPLPYVKIKKVGDYNIYSNDGGKTFIKANRQWRGYDPNNHINSDGSLEGFSSYIPEKPKYAIYQGRKYYRAGSNEFYDITNGTKFPKKLSYLELPFLYYLNGNADWKVKAKNPPSAIKLDSPTTELQEVSTVKDKPETKGKLSSRNISTSKVSISRPLYGLVGEVLKGWKGLKGVIDDQSFANLQSLGYSGERNARAALEWMNNNLSKYGIIGSSVATDNAWGELSSRALKMMMLNKANNALASIPNESPVMSPSYSIEDTKRMITLQEPTLDELAVINASNNPNLRFTPTIFNFNRSQTRDWLRQNAGGSAYAFTGALRAAVRRILAGQGTTLDKLLVQTDPRLTEALKNYFKKGGSLVSRNPVERFKLRNFI